MSAHRDIALPRPVGQLLRPGKPREPVYSADQMRAMYATGFAAWVDLQQQATTRDGTATAGEVVDGLMYLFPGADRQALRCLAALMSKP